MYETSLSRFVARAKAGKLSRRTVLETGLKLGVATPLLTKLWMDAPEASASPVRTGASRFLPTGKQESSGVLTALISVGTEDIDPHYSYATLSSTIALLVYEMLLVYKDDSSSEIEGMLAESWEANEDNSEYTF
ncbi:MAG: hypothetical protein ACKOCK_13310, partial [Chloroflexota bacterium]